MDVMDFEPCPAGRTERCGPEPQLPAQGTDRVHFRVCDFPYGVGLSLHCGYSVDG